MYIFTCYDINATYIYRIVDNLMLLVDNFVIFNLLFKTIVIYLCFLIPSQNHFVNNL